MIDITVPEEQRGRQAVASLGGYVYQILRSVSEWMRLGPDDTLFLEVAEDYAVLSQHALTMTQVKDDAGSGNLTLRSEGVAKAITSVWQHRKANRERTVRMIYLTTAEVGRERGSALPEGLGGIDYWRLAAAGADVEPLRTLLNSLDLDEEILAFIHHASPEELRERLLSPLHWATGANSTPAVLEQLKTRLVGRAAERGLQASDGERALPILVLRALQTAIGQDRRLTQADFEACWEQATTVPVSIALMRQLHSGMASGAEAVPTTQAQVSQDIPLPRRLAKRLALVDELSADLREHGALWLHGSSGLGKSLLARLIVARSNRFWRFVRLRDCDDGEAQARLRDAISAVDRADFGGFVIDDLPVPSGAGFREWLAITARETIEAGGAIIVTSDRGPLPITRLALEPLTVAVREAPYLLLEDVDEIVAAAGGDTEQWSELVRLTCGMGHPLLVDARIAGLASRNWPKEERLSGFVGAGPQEVAGVRTEVALRLLQELSDDAHTLLLRLSVLGGTFDRAMALVVAELAPSLARPGVLFDYLVGPWIEVDAVDRYSLSPLVAQTGVTGLGEQEKRAVHVATVGSLLKRKPFPGDLLNTLLIHSLIVRHLGGLQFIAGAVLTAPDRLAITRALLVLPFITEPDGVHLVPEHAGVSSVLRLAQLISVAAEPNHPMFEKVLDATMKEVATLPTPIRASTLYTALIAVLGAESLSAPPRLWLPLLLDYQALMESGAVPGILVEGMENTDLGGLTTLEFFFYARVSKIDNVNDLVDLFDRLDAVDADLRHTFLGSSARLLPGPPIFIQNAWASAALADSLDAPAAAADYERLTVMAEGWGESVAAIECIRSRAVILDEYLGDTQAALDTLDAGERLHPGDERLARTRANVLGNAGRHEEEHEVLSGLTGTYSIDEPLERAMTLRAAAINAAKLGKYDQACALFLEARTTAEASATWDTGTRTGLLADAAVMAFLSQNQKSALEHLNSALAEASVLDRTNDTSWFTVQVIAQVAQWALARAEGRNYQPDLGSRPGVCSTLASKVATAEREMELPRSYGWYVAARLEALLGIDAGISSELRRIEGEDGITLAPGVAWRLAQLEHSIRSGDLDRFFEVLPSFVTLFVILSMERADERLVTRRSRRFEIVDPVDWTDAQTSVARGLVSAFVGAALLVEDDHLAWSVGERASSLSPQLAGLFPAGLADLELREDGIASGVSATRWLRENETPTAEELLIVSSRLFLWLASIASSEPVDQIWNLLRERWLGLARHRRALLSNPRLAVPAIEKAAEAERGTLASLAEMIEAGTFASTIRLPQGLREHLARAKAR